MLSAFLRLFLITFFVAILGVLAVLALRWSGSQQTFQTPSHPWFLREFWAVYSPTAEELCAAKDLDQSPGKTWIVQVPVTRQGEEWVIPCAKPLELGQFLKHTAHQDFLLKVTAHSTWSLDELVKAVTAFDESKHFAVATEAQKAAVYLRKKAPQWLFAADSASLMRLRTYTSFWVETAMDFWPDFVIADFSAKDAPQIDTRMAAELERRKKRVIWKWDENAQESPPISIQGIMTDRPSAARQKWGTRL